MRSCLKSYHRGTKRHKEYQGKGCSSCHFVSLCLRGVEDAAVILASNTGGSGVFIDLAAVLDEEGEPRHVASAFLGDRPQINSVTIAEGVITVDLVTQGPEDPFCCPTLPLTVSFTLQEDALVEVDSERSPVVTLDGTFTPEADPSTASVHLGGAASLDPMLVSVLSGVVAGQGVDARALGNGCTGVIAPQPDVVLNWAGDDTVETLRILLLSTGDPSLVVVTPAGDVLCNDDFNPLMLDSYLEIPTPAAGRYAIFVGSFEPEAHFPALLAMTTLDYNPATLDLAQLLPRQVDPAAAVTERLPASVLHLAATAPATELEPGFAIYTQPLTGGGSLGAFNIELNNRHCTGFVDAVPTLTFIWSGEAQPLRIFFESDQDSTLVVAAPDGSFLCNDDFAGASNLNPLVEIAMQSGPYAIYIGSFAPAMSVTGTLTITEETTTEPAVLTAGHLPAEPEEGS